MELRQQLMRHIPEGLIWLAGQMEVLRLFPRPRARC